MADSRDLKRCGDLSNHVIHPVPEQMKSRRRHLYTPKYSSARSPTSLRGQQKRDEAEMLAVAAGKLQTGV